ncbi:hypothetical protein R69776_08030 [Paraburkholderia nemoris]|uniref:LysR substrate-binding domain-containing protein n=1 Tax=Paraburkholderia nemoris TaxID=2793076 RepID=A0ABN7N8F3_9BURK|nr:hypothetical protein R75777_07011 [Paraburkholderia nemoris]CAE6861477.1 hypothetical protein R69776_08030 [Paraburkholderia nemoris]
MTLGNTNLMVDASLTGIGIAWVPEYHVRDHLASRRLVRLLSEWCPSMPGLCLYYPANRHPPTFAGSAGMGQQRLSLNGVKGRFMAEPKKAPRRCKNEINKLALNYLPPHPA